MTDKKVVTYELYKYCNVVDGEASPWTYFAFNESNEATSLDDSSAFSIEDLVSDVFKEQDQARLRGGIAPHFVHGNSRISYCYNDAPDSHPSTEDSFDSGYRVDERFSPEETLEFLRLYSKG